MGELAGHSGKDVVKKLSKLGYTIVRIRGSHVRLYHPNSVQYKSLTVPLHKEVRVGLLRQLLKDAHLSVRDFLDL